MEREGAKGWENTKSTYCPIKETGVDWAGGLCWTPGWIITQRNFGSTGNKGSNSQCGVNGTKRELLESLQT